MNLIAYQNAFINLEHVVVARRSGKNLHLTLSNGESFELEGASMYALLRFLEKQKIEDLEQVQKSDDLIVEIVSQLLELHILGPVYVKTVADRVHKSSKSVGTILRKTLHIEIVRRGKGYFLKIDEGQLEQLRHEFGLP